MSREEMVTAPYINHFWLDYEHKVTLGKPEDLPPLERINIMSAFHGGFAAAMTLMHSVPPEHRAEVEQDLKDELKEFSKLSREIGKAIGVGHVSSGKPLEETHPHLFPSWKPKQ